MIKSFSSLSRGLRLRLLITSGWEALFLVALSPFVFGIQLLELCSESFKELVDGRGDLGLRNQSSPLKLDPPLRNSFLERIREQRNGLVFGDLRSSQGLIFLEPKIGFSCPEVGSIIRAISIVPGAVPNPGTEMEGAFSKALSGIGRDFFRSMLGRHNLCYAV
jgi:hypothetical protein